MSMNYFDMDGLYNGPEHPEPGCPTCGGLLDWEPCHGCGGEGDISLYDEDPLWYTPGASETCRECNGYGGWYLCLEGHQGKRNWLPYELESEEP